MGLSSHAQNALKISLGITAARELIPILGFLKDKIQEEKDREPAPEPEAVPTEPEAPAPEPEAPADPPAPPAEEAEDFDAPQS